MTTPDDIDKELDDILLPLKLYTAHNNTLKPINPDKTVARMKTNIQIYTQRKCLVAQIKLINDALGMWVEPDTFAAEMLLDRKAGMQKELAELE